MKVIATWRPDIGTQLRKAEEKAWQAAFDADRNAVM